MASIIIADNTERYDGRDLEARPLGGTESSVIRMARELARRSHHVTVYTNCDGPLEHEGVQWRPLSGTPPASCDLYVAVQHPRLLGFVRNPIRRAIWVVWQPNHLKHYKQIWRVWWYRPIPVLISLHQVRIYSPFLPKRDPHIVIPHGLPDDVRGHPALPSAPPRRAIFASNPRRKLRELVEIWVERIHPRVPDAVLEVYGLYGIRPGEDAWSAWQGSLLPSNVSPAAKRSVRVHPAGSRQELIDAFRSSRVMLYLGHKVEAFCLSLAEAQALGVPAVVAPVAVLPERVIDGVTGFHRADPEGFADAAVSILTDDALWRRQHEAALRHQQGISWSEQAGRFEAALLGDRVPLYRSVLDVQRQTDGRMDAGDAIMTSPAGMPARPIAVLVEREGLGDVLLKLPLLRAIARGFPKTPIWWISTHQTDMAGPLRQFMPGELAVVREHAGLGKPLREAARRLREYPGFSLIFDTRSRIADVWLARHMLAHERFFCCLPGYFLSDARPPGRFTRAGHIGERALSLAQAALGQKADASGRLEATPGARQAAHAVLPEGPLYVGLGVGSRDARKNWPIEKFAELSRRLSAGGMAPVLLLGPREIDRAEAIRTVVPAVASVDLTRSSAGSGSFDFTVAIAERLGAVIANDSGTGHLFGAAGRPIVSLFGPTDPRRWAPFAPLRKTLWAREFGGEAMECIPPEAVVGAVEEILGRTGFAGTRSR